MLRRLKVIIDHVMVHMAGGARLNALQHEPHRNGAPVASSNRRDWPTQTEWTRSASNAMMLRKRSNPLRRQDNALHAQANAVRGAAAV